MSNFEEEVRKFSPSKELDLQDESVLDRKEPDITDILDTLLKEKRSK